MTWAGAVFLVVGFLAVAHWMRVPRRAVEVIKVTNGAIAVIRDPDLDDLVKERTMRATSWRLLVLFTILAVTSMVAVAVPVCALIMAHTLELVDFDGVINVTVSWPFLVGATVFGFAFYAVLVRSRRR